MKLAGIVIILSLVSVALFARDLGAIANKERARRRALAARGRTAREYTNEDLGEYEREHVRPSPAVRPQNKPRPERDLEKERARWRRETEEHERQLSRLDARIRRLEWRLAERRSRRAPGTRLASDPTSELLEDSLEALREERRRIIERFHERARKEGAFPGWLR